jgi:uncharacterized protein
MRLRFSLAGLLILLASFAAIAAVLPERPARYVVDLAGVVEDRAELRLSGLLQELEQKTTAQVIVLTVDTLDGMSIEDFSLQVAEKWKLGQKDVDNGVLMIFAIKDRLYRFEVGYGLEGLLPDSLVGSIGRQYVVPYFKKGDHTNGVAAAAIAVANIIAEDRGVEITGMPRLGPGRGYDGGRAGKPGIMGTIFSILFFIALIYMFIRHPRLLLLLFLFSAMGGRRSAWGGGGGFGGGGFGGFGGGGGGGFGGGGASGSW